MIENLIQIRDRLSSYVALPAQRFETDSGYASYEESLKQKVRQYWADDNVSNQQKLNGFDLDISGFDPRHTTNRELRQISQVLIDIGVIDYDTAGCLGGVDLEFDDMGKEVNIDKGVDVYKSFERQFEFLNKYISEGHTFAKDTITKLKTAMSVMLALEERANNPPGKSLVSIRV